MSERSEKLCKSTLFKSRGFRHECAYFFSKWKNKIFISQFYKKNCHSEKKTTGRALNLAKHIIIISPGWYSIYIFMCVDPMIRSIFHTNGSFLVLLVLLITDLDLDPRRWWWRVNFLKHDQIINSIFYHFDDVGTKTGKKYAYGSIC